MKKNSYSQIFKCILISAVIVFAITSCQKERMEVSSPGTEILNSSLSKIADSKKSTRSYKDEYATWYTVLVPFFYNGAAGVSLPGSGDGHSTHIGTSKIYFNQLVPFDQSPTLPIPVNLYFPDLDVPASVMVDGQLRILNSIILDEKKNNSIWFSLIVGSSIQQPISETRVEFTGETDIVGGTGKFTGATGHTTLSGYFNPTDTADANVSQQGWIRY